MARRSFPLIVLSVATLLLAGGCGSIETSEHLHEIDDAYVDENGNLLEPIDVATHNEDHAPKDKFEEHVALVKSDEEIDLAQLDLDILSIQELYPHSPWKRITLKQTSSFEAVKYLRGTHLFEKVDYDYQLRTDGDVVSVSGNPYSGSMHFHDDMRVRECWNYCAQNDLPIAGSSDVVVAVIDTGVDYNHVDLRNNIWRNTGEIPNNGIDDDDNGYVDDVCGWNFAYSNNDPMDDNGHGTHVAGIIAAENNTVGTVGAAFNCKIMPIKAAGASGYFLDSNIAAAINYAYANGASVINMSFGGSSMALAVQDELETAYLTCNLVAAAGNNHRCDNPRCKKCDEPGLISYPAALSYVVGVMSSSNDTMVSTFSNYCHLDTYNVFANGEGIISTWPNNRYATLNGTSMAAPHVSSAAAILRSVFRDRDLYSTKFINSQITNTGIKYLYNVNLKNSSQDTMHALIDYVKMIVTSPSPMITGFTTKFFDSTSISPNNNGNKLIEPGETIHIAIEANNRGGKASDIEVIASQGGFDPTLVDPNYTITKASMTMDDIGTYSKGDCRYILDENGEPMDAQNYIEVVISDTCPDRYPFDLNFSIRYRNGLDPNDGRTYETNGSATFEVLRGIVLPRYIEEDMTLKRNGLYLADKVTTLPGVNLTVEDGVEIEPVTENAFIKCDAGRLLMVGTLENPIVTNVRFIVSQAELSYVNGSRAIEYDELNTGSWKDCLVVYRNCRFIFNNVGTTLKLRGTSFEDCYFKGFEISAAKSSKSSSYGIDRCCMEECHPTTLIFTNNVCYNGAVYPGISPDLYWKNNVFSDCSVQFDMFALPGVFEDNKFVNNCRFSRYTDQYGRKVVDWEVQTGEADYSILWPHVESLSLFDSQHNPIEDVVLKEKFYAEVVFNRPMDTTKPFKLAFGSADPYRDYLIPGEFTSSTKWEGEYTINAMTEGGFQYFNFLNAESAENMELLNDGPAYKFAVRSGGLYSMSLQALATPEGIELSWVQDDYDTLMGYNLYRSESKDGNYVRINPSIIPSDENTFLDDSVEPGKSYWYTFTVVLSDFTESGPAGKVNVVSTDTIPPVIYHTPVNQAYANNALTIRCNVSDNIAVTGVTLFYRTTGETEWKSFEMIKSNDRFVGVIYGGDVTLDGLEYFISATDGRNVITRGSMESPYHVVVKDPASLDNLGDVDGDGMITTKDALMILRAINDELILTDDQFRRADLNKDGILSTFEALRILQYVNGNVTSVEM